MARALEFAAAFCGIWMAIGTVALWLLG
jgi:hypothetical protein